MHKMVRHHRTHLYPYDLIDTLLWNLPFISPIPTPPAPHLWKHKSPLRKIYLVPLGLAGLSGVAQCQTDPPVPEGQVG